jgi:hypothetical protein
LNFYEVTLSLINIKEVTKMSIFRKNLLSLLSLFIVLTLMVCNLAAAEQSQYNMSLQDKVITGPKGPQAASVNELLQLDRFPAPSSLQIFPLCRR